MRAMTLEKPYSPLVLTNVLMPKAKKGQLVIEVKTCGVCRTDLHIQEGDLTPSKFPLILGHQIVGRVVEIGPGATGFSIGDRVGIPWLAKTCGQCNFCLHDKENLCDKALFTGFDIPGGFAEYTTCFADYAIRLPSQVSDIEAAPLLCAGLIGYRAYEKANPEELLGIYGFGSAAHLLTQLAVFQRKRVYAFTKKGDYQGQEFARKLGAIWAGSSDSPPPELLDAAILFASDGNLVPLALRSLKKGGSCICAEIHMNDIPSFPYQDLRNEKKIETVANLTRKDAQEFFSLLSQVPIHPTYSLYKLEEANQALQDLKEGRIKGSCILQISSSLYG